MPPDLKKVGKQLASAGTQQTATGNKLKTSSDKVRLAAACLDDDQTIASSLTAIESGIRSIRTLLGMAANGFRTVAVGIRSIQVPSVTARRKTFTIGPASFTAVIGVDVAMVKPFSGPAAQIDKVAKHLDNVCVALLTIANGSAALQASMPLIQQQMNASADDMSAAGDSLVLSGTAMKGAGNAISP